MEGTITVAELKKEVERATGIPTEAQRLLHKGSLAGVYGAIAHWVTGPGVMSVTLPDMWSLLALL